MKFKLVHPIGTIFGYFMLTILCFAPVSKAAVVTPHGTKQSNAALISVNDKAFTYKFNYFGDDNWFIFYAYKGRHYDIEIPQKSVDKGINPAIELYDAKGALIRSHDLGFSGEGELFSWSSVPEDAYYYLRVSNRAKTYSPDAHFALKVYLSEFPNNLVVKGVVTDQCTQKGINEAVIDTSLDATLTYKTGEFALAFPPGTYTLTARIQGYSEQSQTVTLKKGDLEDYVIQTVNFALLPKVACPPIKPVPNSAQLKERASALYDELNHELLIKDVRFGAQSPILAKLVEQANLRFKLLDITLLNADNLINLPGFYDFDTGLIDLPSVFAFGKLFHIQLKMVDPVNFVFELAGTPTEIP